MTISRHNSKLTRVCKYYSTALPDWDISEAGRLHRIITPFVQIIWLQQMSISGYRPTSFVSVLCAPDCGHSLLFREIRGVGNINICKFSEHEEMKERVLNGMKTQFVPDILQSPSSHDILTMAKTDVGVSVEASYGLACAYAWFQMREEFDSTRRLHASQLSHLYSPIDRHLRQLDFIDRVAGWLDAGTSRTHLDEVVYDECKKFCSQ